MKTSTASVLFASALTALSRADFTVLMYTDSGFEDYVGQVRFDATDRCYPLCADSETVAAFVWDPEPQGTQLVVFENVECQGRSVTGERTTGAQFSAFASKHKVRSFLLSTTTRFAPTRGVMHSCDEKTDLVYKPYNDTAVWT